jgi:hypothetical protein
MTNLPLPGRCLALTGSFETGKLPPDCFCALTGDFDGQGLSFGALQWNIGQGSLQPLFQQMLKTYPALHSFVSGPLAEQLAFSRSIQTANRIHEPWRSQLIELGRSPECWAVQTNLAAKAYQSALRLCNRFELTSERAVALMFDIVTQNGSISKQVRVDPKADEQTKLVSLAHQVAAAANPKYRADVQARKLLIANGQGIVHGIHYDLAQTFNLTLNPYAPRAAQPLLPAA